MNQLGVLYGRGLGVKKDIHAAIDFYKEAAEQGDPLGYTNIAYFYENGDLGKTDIPAAVKLYQVAALAGEPHAIEALERLGYPQLENNVGLE